MKILMTSHYTLPHHGGIEIIVENLSRSLVQHGHEIKIVTSDYPGVKIQSSVSREFIGVKNIDPLMPFGVHYPIYSPSIFHTLSQAVKWADIVHVQGMLYINAIIAVQLAKKMGRPTILTEHAGYVNYSQSLFNTFQRIAINIIGKKSLSLSDIVLVPDTIVQEILTASLNVSPQKVDVIPFGVDTSVFHPVSSDQKIILRKELGWDNRPKILFVGNFVARKRFNLLIDALTEDFDIVLCGEGTPPQNTSKQVRVYPGTEHKRLVKFYQAADLFVVPSSVETFSIVSYEAMACGLPVIMTDDLSHLTIVKSGLVKIVKPNKDELKQAITALLTDTQEKLRLGKISSSWIQEHYSWETSIVKHIAIYEHLLHKIR